MQITRRGALLGASAAAVTGLTVAPIGMKTANVRAALAGDPVLPAYEAFEAVRRAYIAANDHVDAIREAVTAEMPPEPSAGRGYLEMSDAEQDEEVAWMQIQARRVEDRLGADEDDIMNVHSDRIWDGCHDLMDIQATTVAGLLCQVRAWWAVNGTVHDTEVPEPGPEDHIFEPQVLVQRLYHDVARGPARGLGLLRLYSISRRPTTSGSGWGPSRRR